MRSPISRFYGAALLTTVLAAGGLPQLFGTGEETADCPLVIAQVLTEASFDVSEADALCVPKMEVNGRVYMVGVGRFLDETALKTAQYGTISRSNEAVADPTVWALEGVDPEAILLMSGNDSAADNVGGLGEFMVLWGPERTIPASLCAYADQMDPQYPAQDCPLAIGQVYEIEIRVPCGADGVLPSRIGGGYWELTGVGLTGTAGSPDYGTVTLVTSDTAVYRSDQGSDWELRRSGESESSVKTCEIPKDF